MNHLNALLGRIVEQNPMQRPFFDKVLPAINPAERADLEAYIGHCIDAGVDRDELLEVVRRVSLMAQRNSPLRLRFADGEVTVEALRFVLR